MTFHTPHQHTTFRTSQTLYGIQYEHAFVKNWLSMTKKKKKKNLQKGFMDFRKIYIHFLNKFFERIKEKNWYTK